MMNTIRRTATLVVIGLAVLGVSTLAGASSFNAGSTGIESSAFIDIEKFIAVDSGAWQDADFSPGPEVADGSFVEFRFVVTNLTADQFLIAINLTDSILDLSGCTVPSMLFPAQSFECVVGPLDCIQGQHSSTGTVTGLAFGDLYVDSDDANYYGLGGGEQPGVAGPGFWKKHPEEWPVGEITVGGMIYTRDEAIDLMSTPARGDKTYTMFRSLVAAMLNVMVGNDSSCIADVIVEADGWMALYPVGSNVRGKSDAWQENEWLHEVLDEYNNGLLCAPPRD
jgi:hypothetical protein